MKVIIEKQVEESILEFYVVSMQLHPTLDWGTVTAKVARLYAAMKQLETLYSVFPKARLKSSWVESNYREMIVEDFHVAYRVEFTEDEGEIVHVHDAVHSLLYH
ncbi:MAG: hypothetical protein MJZ53_05005 [Paludibacteraceae bacterium]|nr:hypothetical protein [Paludibacteraceae bacterium]